tara:strand:+ start:1888 stop:2868 length:981 start_codon:yes stop_codon:yes gene_type:complete
MILRYYEINKVDLTKNNIILLYGKNEGAKNEAINSLVKDKSDTLSYDQNEVLEKQNILFEDIYNQSLFEEKRTIIIKRVNDKFLKIIEEIDLNKISNTKIILESENLEKKSKLRSKFEKDKNFICVAFYPDTDQTLIKIAIENLKQKKISLSTSLINIVVNQCNGDREILYNQIKKIEMYSKNGKKINEEKLSKLINLNENQDITELVNYYLIRNKKKITSILNENNFTNEDCVAILRVFMNKIKRLLILANSYKNNNNIELTISSAKPPIFWKEKEITKQQIIKWKPENIKELIYSLNELEHILKKNINNSIYLMTNFILEEKYL